MTRLAKQLPWDHPIARKLNHEVHRRKMAGKSLYERRKALSNALFDQIVRDQSHKLHDLLPPRNGSTYCTRSQRYFKLPICKTNRFKNTFIMANSFNY